MDESVSDYSARVTFEGAVADEPAALAYEPGVLIGVHGLPLAHDVRGGRLRLALLDKLSSLLDMEVNTADLESTAETYQEQVSVAVSQDSDLSSYVRMLEERFDSQADQGPRNLPSGDELAQELEGFLREHRREEDSE